MKHKHDLGGRTVTTFFFSSMKSKSRMLYLSSLCTRRQRFITLNATRPPSSVPTSNLCCTLNHETDFLHPMLSLISSNPNPVIQLNTYFHPIFFSSILVFIHFFIYFIMQFFSCCHPCFILLSSIFLKIFPSKSSHPIFRYIHPNFQQLMFKFSSTFIHNNNLLPSKLGNPSPIFLFFPTSFFLYDPKSPLPALHSPLPAPCFPLMR